MDQQHSLYLGWASSNSSGTLTVTNGGVVTTGTLYASLSSLLGNGTITAKGAVMDANLQLTPRTDFSRQWLSARAAR